MSNWISQIQWNGRIQYFNSQLLGNYILAFTINFCSDFIDFIFIIIYAVIVIAYLGINLLMPDVDVNTEAVVISVLIS